MEPKRAHEELQELKALTREFYDIVNANEYYSIWFAMWVVMDNLQQD